MRKHKNIRQCCFTEYKRRPARLHGKISTFLIDFTLIVLFLFKTLPDWAVWTMISACLAAAIVAAVMYFIMYKKSFKAIKENE